MKKLTITIIVLVLSFVNITAQTIPLSEIQKSANSWLTISRGFDNHRIFNYYEIEIEDDISVYVFELSPTGFVVTTNNYSLAPVVSYSYKNNFMNDGPLKNMIISDLQNQVSNFDLIPDKIIRKNNDSWNNLIDGSVSKTAFQQWPEQGTTTTGGWVETEWSQQSPYNDFCPLDLVNGGRSVAGCPSIAISMIVNYTNTINGTRFTDDDKYYHNYGGNSYWIDDEYLTYDFASFSSINGFFESTENKYSNNEPLDNDEIASLVFACGVAARQVYSEGGSGTFGVDQAWDSFVRFGFEDASLVYETDTTFYTQMQDNIKDAMPVLLALLVTNGPGGHNIVADGYNTEDFYHLNFGWGGMHNGWYNVPEGIPYNLTTVEGAIVDIGTKQVGIVEKATETKIVVSPVPAVEAVNISFNLETASNVAAYILDSKGNSVVGLCNSELYSGMHTLTWNSTTPGIYFAIIKIDEEVYTEKLIVM